MDWILDRLACGALDDVSAALSPSLTAILSLCEAQPPAVPGRTMIHAPIPDEMVLPGQVWDELTGCLSGLLMQGHAVLVHCRLGVSRAPSLCAAYLIRCGFGLDAARELVCQRRVVAQPHAETWRGVVVWRATRDVAHHGT